MSAADKPIPERTRFLRGLTRIVQRAELRRGEKLRLEELEVPLSEAPLDQIECSYLPPNARGIIALHLAGFTHADISRSTGMSPSAVAHALSHPKSQPLLDAGYAVIDRDLKGLYGPAVDALREGLFHEDTKVSLKATEMVMRALGKLDAPKDGKGATAEDVVRKILEIRSEGPVQITMGEERESS